MRTCKDCLYYPICDVPREAEDCGHFEKTIIRCKECKFFLRSNEKCELVDTRLHFYETDKRWTEDCFCSWAEREEE